MVLTLFDQPTAQTIIHMPDVIPQPKYPPVMEVINKILNVKKNNKARITTEDQQEMNRLQGFFTEQNDKLDRWEMLIKFELENLYPGLWKCTQDTDDPRYIEFELEKPETENPFSHFEFNAEGMLGNINRHRYDLKKSFVAEIFSYFRDKYSLEYFRDYDHIINETYSYETVLDYLFTKVSTSSLQDNAKAVLMEKFNSLIHGKHKATAAKNTVVFPHINFYRFNESDSDCLTFFTILGYFENGKVGEPLWGTIPKGDYRQAMTYQLGGDKITSVKFFQNGKAILYFNNEMTANEFFNLS